jgi:hypothetical protein
MAKYRFADFSRPVAFSDCPEIPEALKKIFVGWNIRPDERTGAPAPIIKLSKPDHRYLWLSDHIQPRARWANKRPTTITSTIADFHYKFYDWYTMTFPTHLCLHCAAVQIGGGLVIFPNTQKVGKSTLTTRLAMAGKRVFCDDVLSYCPTQKKGLALGILPRVRLPLPDSLPDAYKAYIKNNTALGSENYAYIQPSEKTFAPYGQTLPIHAVVILDRNEDVTAAQIEPINSATAMSAILHQNFVVENSPTETFDHVLEMLKPCELITMRYSNLDDAANALVDHFETAGA